MPLVERALSLVPHPLPLDFSDALHHITAHSDGRYYFMFLLSLPIAIVGRSEVIL